MRRHKLYLRSFEAYAFFNQFEIWCAGKKLISHFYIHFYTFAIFKIGPKPLFDEPSNIPKILPIPFSTVPGKFSSLSVCPVGAVSKITQLYSMSVISFMTSEKLTASSTPGKVWAKSCIIFFMPLSEPVISSGNPSTPTFGSISIANRLSNPSTLVGTFENFWSYRKNKK